MSEAVIDPSVLQKNHSVGTPLQVRHGKTRLTHTSSSPYPTRCCCCRAVVKRRKRSCIHKWQHGNTCVFSCFCIHLLMMGEKEKKRPRQRLDSPHNGWRTGASGVPWHRAT